MGISKRNIDVEIYKKNGGYYALSKNKKDSIKYYQKDKHCLGLGIAKIISDKYNNKIKKLNIRSKDGTNEEDLEAIAKSIESSAFNRNDKGEKNSQRYKVKTKYE